MQTFFTEVAEHMFTRYFFAPFYLRHWKDNPPVIDELFDTFVVDNYIKKYCRGKHAVIIVLHNTSENNTKDM